MHTRDSDNWQRDIHKASNSSEKGTLLWPVNLIPKAAEEHVTIVDDQGTMGSNNERVAEGG